MNGTGLPPPAAIQNMPFPHTNTPHSWPKQYNTVHAVVKRFQHHL